MSNPSHTRDVIIAKYWIETAFPLEDAAAALAGVDHLHVNSLQNKFCEPDDSVVRSIQACLTPVFGEDRALPVVSSGQRGGPKRRKPIDARSRST